VIGDEKTIKLPDDGQFYCLLVKTFGLPLLLSLLLSLILAASYASYAQDDTPQLSHTNHRIELVSSDLEDPTTMAFIGPDDILVAEKDKGTIQRIVNGDMLDEPLLDVNVNSSNERGMLGIAITRNDTSGKNYVFLFYTEADEVGAEPIGNRLYRYELSDDSTRLVNRKLLLDLPYLPGPDHNGGVVTVGPDDNVYIALGELLRTSYGGTDYNTLTQNSQDGLKVDGRGGILRVTQDGEVVNGTGILGDEHPLDMYYAYGIRNSFGITFDPLTGKMWDTENGPGFGDELNLVEPGFNSGWSKVQGTWNVIQSINEEGTRNIDRGDTVSGDPTDLVDFNGHGKYSEPEFTWDKTIAPTALVFISSDKFGESNQNDLLVASYLNGTIFHFKLNEERTGLVLHGNLADKVASDIEMAQDQEYENLIFGRGLGTITDMEIGPDGNLYVLTGARENEGKIYRISAAEN
jgi:aldose sugar dehydrogenase